MLKPLQDRERGLSGSPISFTKAAYVAALPTLRMEGSLTLHRGCVNHISFSESGGSMLINLSVRCLALQVPEEEMHKCCGMRPNVHAKGWRMDLSRKPTRTQRQSTQVP